jgi:hypothetical protein
MGILIHTTFETAQGLPVTDVYGRITGVHCNVIAPNIVVTVEFETHISREKRLQGATSIFVPNLPYRVSKTVPLESTDQWGSMQALYTLLKDGLTEAGYTSVTDVLVDPVPVVEPEAETTA